MTQHFYEDVATKLAANMSATRPNTAMDVVRVTDLSGTTLAVNFDVRVENELLRVTAISVDGGGSGIDRWTASHIGGAAASTHAKGQEVEVIITAYALENDIVVSDDDSAYVTKATLTTNGDIFSRIAGVVSRLAIGSTGQVLAVVSGLPAWVTRAVLDAITTKGDVIVGDGSGVPVRLAVGSNGKVLTANSAATNGVDWETPSAGFTNPMTTKGDIIAADTGGTPDRLAVGTNGQVLTADSTQTTGLKWGAAGSGSSPLTTKGDVWGYDTADNRIPVGSNGQVLTADSTAALGLKWAAASGGATVPNIKQVKRNGTAGITSLTLDAAPASGDTIFLIFNQFSTGSVTSVASTNTTWTKLKNFTSTGGAIYDLWIGAVSGTGGTSITWTNPNSFTVAVAVVIGDTKTTAGATGSANLASSGMADTAKITGLTVGRLLILAMGCDNTGQLVTSGVSPDEGSVGYKVGTQTIWLMYTTQDPVIVQYSAATAGALVWSEAT